jgi:predicted RNase H-related nuclease YkuK (DUF458 family)
MRENFLQGYFYSPSQNQILFPDVIKEIINYIENEPKNFYEIIVGCDSSSSHSPNFCVVITILRKGKGGRFFIKKIDYSKTGEKNFYNWKQRILEEIFLSCELAIIVKEKLLEQAKTLPFSFNYRFEYIHADIGENGETKSMIQEITKYIEGNNFKAKIKPEAYTASTIADKYID